MKKVLFLTSRLPYPPIGGDRLKNYWLLKILSKKFNVHLISITDKEIPNGFYEWVSELGITYKVFRKRKINFYINGLKFLINSLPIQVNYFYFKDVQDYVNSIYKEFDLLFSTLIRTALYIIYKDKPKIIDLADSIGLNYLSSKNITKSIKWKILYNVEANRVLKFENLCVDLFDKSLFFNEQEMKWFNNNAKTIWVPHGVNEELLKYEKVDPKYKNCITFFGKMDCQHNIDAVKWFVDNVLCYLDKNLKFYIIGANPPMIIKKLEKKYSNVVVTGFVEDPYIIIKSSVCNVAPMQTGGGIQNKVLESMALGTINIVSSLAARGIKGIHGEHFLVVDNPNEMIRIISEIYQKPYKYEYLKKASREYIKHNFTWEIYENNLMKVIDDVLK